MLQLQCNFQSLMQANFAATLKITVADSSDCLSQRLVSLLYLNGLPLSDFISGCQFIGTDRFPLPLLRLEPVSWKGIHLLYDLSSTLPASRVHNKTRVLNH